MMLCESCEQLDREGNDLVEAYCEVEGDNIYRCDACWKIHLQRCRPCREMHGVIDMSAYNDVYGRYWTRGCIGRKGRVVRWEPDDEARA